MHYFSYSGGPGAVSIKKHVGTGYTELVFLYTVGSVYHVVHSGASGVKKHRRTIFLARVSPVRFA
jgi:hypothetical protein